MWDVRKKACRQSDLKWGMTGVSADIGKVFLQSYDVVVHIASSEP